MVASENPSKCAEAMGSVVHYKLPQLVIYHQLEEYVRNVRVQPKLYIDQHQIGGPVYIMNW